MSVSGISKILSFLSDVDRRPAKSRKALAEDLTAKAARRVERVISDILIALGWPGDKELTAREDATTERWKDQLSELSSLGLVCSPVTFHTALGQLRHLLSVRSERGDWLSPIQVLDASQAGGVEFDAAIAVGLSEDTWPPPTRFSPLVPLKLQKQYNASANIREERVKQTQVLFESSPELVVTYSERLTSLAVGFVSKKGKDLPHWTGHLPLDSFESEELDQQRDGQAPALFAAGVEVRGGTNLIKAQSQCPFQAFAKYRLHARRPEDASFGFDVLDRGTFVHKSLEFVWRRLGSLHNLLHMPAADLATLVSESIAEAGGRMNPAPCINSALRRSANDCKRSFGLAGCRTVQTARLHG